MSLSEEELEKLRAEYGENCTLVDKTEQGLGFFLFRTPTPVSYQRWFDAVSSEKKGVSKLTAFQQLCRECLVFPVNETTGKPDQVKLTALFEKFSAIPSAIGADLISKAGGDDSHLGKL